jgi:seryl-tRNA synthetase
MPSLAPAGPAGVYVKSAAFKSLTDGLSRAFHGILRADVGYAPPPVTSWDHLDRCGYTQKFPQIVARVSPLIEREGEDGLGLLPAACLPIYPLVAGQGPIAETGLLVGTQAQCFRQEDAYSEVRLRAFSMSEWVFFGRAAQVAHFRRDLLGKIETWIKALGLQGRVRAANDPFYGRGREILIEAQLEQNLKLELTLPIGEHGDVACFSFNHHADFFSQRFNIMLAEGGPAHSACAGVGLERLALAMIDRHGPNMNAWPPAVRKNLWGEA